MPRMALPPTPASSTDITGEKESQPSSLEASFLLPPPAMTSAGSKTSASTLQSRSPSTATTFSLPPPPTRSRKIIQMKPRQKQPEQQESPPPIRPTSKGTGKKGASASSTAPASGGKKQPSATSAAGKRMARKTAHSVIERRRRSKMNEEFGVLKDMIPACKDQDMHKLAILQASIDYLRYLEKCIVNLQAANASMANPPRLQTSFSPINDNDNNEEDIDNQDEDGDQKMTDQESTVTTPALSTPLDSRRPGADRSPQSTHPSPALDGIGPFPLSSSSQGSSSSCTFPPPSPSFPGPLGRFDYSLSTSTSPMLVPDPRHPDHEATSALLMLNQDRRNPSSGRGMSVKDLLSA